MNHRNRNSQIFTFVTLVATPFALGLWLPRPALGGSAPTGAETFAQECTMCHGNDGSGNTLMRKALRPKDLRSAAVQKKPDMELARIIDNGKGAMPAYAWLGEERVSGLVSFIRSLKKNESKGAAPGKGR